MRSLSLMILILTTLMVAACTIKEREPKTPPPTFKQVKTDFFFEYSKDRKTYKPKRFLFGMMLQDLSGSRAIDEYQISHYNFGRHANVEFEFNADGSKLIGRLVDTDYPHQRHKWPIILEFRVNSNYYEEHPENPSGGKSRDVVRRGDKGDPRARPFIDLEISSMEIKKNDYVGPLTRQRRVTQFIEDVDWAKGTKWEGKYLGFTAHLQTDAGASIQSTERVNFLRIEDGDGTFEETPYSVKNDKFINMVDILGETPNFSGQKLRLVHWDINAKTQKKHTIYLHNFPDEYLQVAKDAIESWNDAFEEIFEKDGVKGYRPLEYAISEREHAFDLRYHSIIYVDDLHLSSGMATGLANMASDVRTGKVLWTASIVWGGLLDYIAAQDIPSAVSSLSDVSKMNPSNNMFHLVPQKMSVWSRPRVKTFPQTNYDQELVQDLMADVEVFTDLPVDRLVAEKAAALQELVRKGEMEQAVANQEVYAYRAELNLQRENLKSLVLRPSEIQSIWNEVQAHRTSPEDLNVAMNYIANNPYDIVDVLSSQGLPHQSHFDLSNDYGSLPPVTSTAFQKIKEGAGETFRSQNIANRSHVFDIENSAVRYLNDVNSSLQHLTAQGNLIDIYEVKKKLLKRTIVHEIGHTLGLGHNFEENILPKKGDVPNYVYNPLYERAKKNMTNQHSIMGYPAGLTKLLTPYEEFVPGRNDINRLHFLYRQQYIMYDKSSRGTTDYVFRDLKPTGEIPKKEFINGKWHEPGYLPSCNNLEASYYDNPFCNMHDRGYNAETLAQEYFDYYWRQLMLSLESSIDSLKSRSYEQIEGYLWGLSAKTMSRTRFFYDYMRLYHRDKVESLKSGSGNVLETYQNIIGFSKSCEELKGKSETALAEYADRPIYKLLIEKNVDGEYEISEMGDLCLATLVYFDNLKQLLALEGNDYHVIDYFDRLMPGSNIYGINRLNFDQAYGSWKRISLMPIKFSIISSLLLPYPAMVTSRGQFPLSPYDATKNRFNVSTLFPQEHLEVVRALVESAIDLEVKDQKPLWSRSLLYLGYFLRFQEDTADYGVFKDKYLDAIMDQTIFRFSTAFIQVEANKVDNGEFVKTFQGYINNRYNENVKETLGQIYLYTLDRFVSRAQTNSLILPVSSIRWQTPTSGVAGAIKLDYLPNDDYKELGAVSPRSYFIDRYSLEMKKCIDAKDGLSSYFKAKGSEFEGIFIPYDIDTNSKGYSEINKSVREQMALYQERVGFNLDACERALESQRLLVLGASLLSGMMFPDTEKFLEGGR